MAARMIHAGETPASQISRAAATGRISWVRESLMARAVVRQGTTIRATTAGRNPLKAFSTQTLSRTWVKKRVMAKIISKEGRIVRYAQYRAPLFFFSL